MMTEDEKKWVESLKRCLKKKPHSIDVLVQEIGVDSDGIGSEIHIFKTGELSQAMSEVDDLMKFNPDEKSLVSFRADGWSGNNHGY